MIYDIYIYVYTVYMYIYIYLFDCLVVVLVSLGLGKMPAKAKFIQQLNLSYLDCFLPMKRTSKKLTHRWTNRTNQS